MLILQENTTVFRLPSDENTNQKNLIPLLGDSPGGWVKVSRRLLENGIRVGNLTEELNVLTEITEFKSDDWFDDTREVMGDDRIDLKLLHFLDQKKVNPFFGVKKD